jgi:hypothetical protein
MEADSAFNGITMISGADTTFHVLGGVTYGASGSSSFTLESGAILSGGGTIKADIP